MAEKDVERPSITPDMKVVKLLEYYPEVEDTLMSLSPEFRRLKNPLLRRTMAKIATLRQAAKVGGVNLGEMITRLREAAGVEVPLTGESLGDEAEPGSDERPAWWKEPVATFDARELIETDGHPLPKVMKDLQKLNEGEVYELITPFVPEPLLDLARKKGYLVWTARASTPGEVRSYFTRSPARRV